RARHLDTHDLGPEGEGAPQVAAGLGGEVVEETDPRQLEHEHAGAAEQSVLEVARLRGLVDEGTAAVDGGGEALELASTAAQGEGHCLEQPLAAAARLGPPAQAQAGEGDQHAVLLRLLDLLEGAAVELRLREGLEQLPALGPRAADVKADAPAQAPYVPT